MLGYAILKDIDYAYIGILDANISFELNYYEFIINAFLKDDSLGLAGGLMYDVFDGKILKWVARLDSVLGCIQMFRKKYFEQLGGFIPNELGGEDAIADWMAYVYDWRVQTFTDVKVLHHRRLGTAGQSIWRARFLQGQREYLIGYHSLFEIAKCFKRIMERFYLLGSMLWLTGYFYEAFTGKKRTVLLHVVKSIQKRQISLLLKSLNFKKKEMKIRLRIMFFCC